MTTSPPAIEQLSIDHLIPYAANSRTHPAEQIQQIADSIQRLGFLNPILIDPSGVIIAGHGRYEAAKQLGLRTVPVIRLSDLTEEQARCLRIEDNAISAASKWDVSALVTEVERLADTADASLSALLQNLDPESLFSPATPAESDSPTDYYVSVAPSTPHAGSSSSGSESTSKPRASAPDTIDASHLPRFTRVGPPSRLPAAKRPCIDTRDYEAMLSDLSGISGLTPDELYFFKASASRQLRFNYTAIRALYAGASAVEQKFFRRLMLIVPTDPADPLVRPYLSSKAISFLRGHGFSIVPDADDSDTNVDMEGSNDGR